MSEQTDDNRSDHDDERDNENDNDNDDELFSDVEVDKLPPAEQARALERAQAAKAEGNDKYQRKEYDEAIDCYSKALDLTLPTDFKGASGLAVSACARAAIGCAFVWPVCASIAKNACARRCWRAAEQQRTVSGCCCCSLCVCICVCVCRLRATSVACGARVSVAGARLRRSFSRARARRGESCVLLQPSRVQRGAAKTRSGRRRLHASAETKRKLCEGACSRPSFLFAFCSRLLRADARASLFVSLAGAHAASSRLRMPAKTAACTRWCVVCVCVCVYV